MTTPADNFPSAARTIEGYARVVGLEGAVAWLEPEQTTSCGGCAAAASCGSPGLGSIAGRISARRFPLDNRDALVVGERVVVGVADRALLKAALTAFALPMMTAFMAGGLAQWADGSNPITMGAMAAGLVIGFLASRIAACRLAARGELAPRFLRRARQDETCHGG